MPNKWFCLCLLLSLFTLSGPSFSASPYVEDDESEYMPESSEDIGEEMRLTAKDVDFNKIESFGLLEQSAGEGLGRQFYSNSRRSVMQALIQNMPKANWIVMRDLSNQVLLTSANTDVLDNDKPVAYEKGRDLLTLRIEKLLERGFYREAYALYTRLKIEPYNEKIARLGIISMLINGQKPLACVEIKTYEAPFLIDIFWKEMDAFCVLSLTDTPMPEKQGIIAQSKNSLLPKLVTDKTFRFPYTPKTFGSLSLLEKALLISEHRLDISGLSPKAFKSIPAEHVQALLALPDLDNTQKILLNLRGFETGVISPAELARVYIRIGRKAEKEKKPLEGLEAITTLYWKRADTFEPELRASTIQQILEHARTQGYAVLVPFLDEIQAPNQTDSFTLSDIEMIIQAYFMAGKEVPFAWLDRIGATPAVTPQETKTKQKLMISAALMSGDSENSSEKLVEIYGSLKNTENKPFAALKNIIENIDNRTGNYAKVGVAYEKDFDLAVNKGYKMPAFDIMNQVELSSQGHATGETVLLCNLILQGLEPKAIPPVMTGVIARSLSEVGLGKQSQRLLAEVVLNIEQ